MKALTTYSKYLFVLITLLSLASLSYAQQTAEQYIERTNYLLYLPEGYKADTITRWPLLIFLHGAGETGSNVEKVKLHGPPRRIADGHQYPFIVISPQSAQYGWNSELLIKLLKDFMEKYRVDEDRVYLTGLSMGGYGTWSTAMSYPEYFAAIIPICGGGQPEGVKRLKNMPVWCFHGAKDNVVPISQSEKMMTPLQAINPKQNSPYIRKPIMIVGRRLITIRKFTTGCCLTNASNMKKSISTGNYWKNTPVLIYFVTIKPSKSALKEIG